jgi:S-DNA-T family DNA segregation ATPase FtsK/SpoIIIE
MDSVVILDRTGAEQLLGKGDMLFSQDNEIIRGQGAYVTDDEIEAINNEIGTDEPDFDEELLEMDSVKDEDSPEDSSDGRSKVTRDETYYKAVDLVIQMGRGSVSMLQTRLGIGYPRASRMMDFMEEDGVVGKANGSKPRHVLVTAYDWRRKRNRTQERGAYASRQFSGRRDYEESCYEEEAEFVAT